MQYHQAKIARSLLCTFWAITLPVKFTFEKNLDNPHWENKQSGEASKEN